MKTQWRVMFLACCLAFSLLSVTAMSAGLPDDAPTGLAPGSSQIPDEPRSGDFENAADYVAYGEREFFCDDENEDKLYVLEKSGGDTRLVLDEHIIALLAGRNDFYAFAYREGEDSTRMFRVNPDDLTFSERETLSGVVTSMARRGDTVYFATDEGILSLNPDNHAKSLFLAADNVATLYFSDYDSLKYYTNDGRLNVYSFSQNALVTENSSGEQASLLDGGYVPRLEAPARDNPYYTTLNVFHQSGFGMVSNNGNCTCYAFGRSYENLGAEPKLSHRNAGLWYGENQKNNAYPYGASVSNPALGAVVVWSKNGAAGHVAVVEAIDGNTVTTSESGWKQFYFKTRARKITSANLSAGSAYAFLGYIYVCGEPAYMVPGCYRVTASSLRMRSDAGTEYRQVASVPRDAELNVTQKSASGSYTWGYASYNGVSGWVALNYCRYLGEIPEAQEETPEPEQPQEPEQEENNRLVVTVTNGSGSGAYAENASVPITANASEPGKRFKEWVWSGADELTFASGSKDTEEAVFIMPATSVDVTAVYEDVPSEIYVASVTQSLDADGKVNVISNVQCPAGAADVFCAAYDESGKMLSALSYPVTETQTYQFQFSDGRFSYAKAFLLGAGFTPLCAGKYS